MPALSRTVNNLQLTFNKIKQRLLCSQAADSKSTAKCQLLNVQSKSKGFTLIELLTVIVIIGILVSIGFASFSNAQLKSRDSKRKTDVSNIQKALELAKQDTPGAFYYPSCAPAAASCGSSSLNPALAPTYVKSVPQDPKTGLDYTYLPTPDVPPCDGTCTGYSLVACLENARDPQRDASKYGGCSEASYTQSPN